DLLQPVKRRRESKVVALLQRAEELLVDVAPFAHARETQEMFATEPPQLRLAHRFELVVVRVPDVEQREKIRIGMRETPVRSIRHLLLIERPLARILNRKPRRDHQHLAQRLLRALLET